jgi:lipopolysaccharide export system protein LptA
MLKLSLLLFLLSLWTFGAAQSGNLPSSQQPIQIRADSLEIDLKNTQATYTGQVQIVQDNFQLSADKVIVFFDKQQPTRLEANGNPVRFQQQSKELWQGEAKRLSYRFDNGLLTLEGNAQLSQGKNQMRSQSLTYDLNQSRLKASGSGGIEMLLYPSQKVSP